MRMRILYMRILQDNELVACGELVGYHNDKIWINDIMERWKLDCRTVWGLLCSPSISGRWSRKSRDHTIETQVKNLVEDTVKTQVENVEQTFNSLNISCSGYTEDEILSLTFWPQLYAKLDELDRVAQKIIQKEMPSDESVVLTLTDIMLDKSGCYDAFALGYDIGESPAGHLYVLVSFDENFTAQQDVIYETL